MTALTLTSDREAFLRAVADARVFRDNHHTFLVWEEVPAGRRKRRVELDWSDVNFLWEQRLITADAGSFARRVAIELTDAGRAWLADHPEKETAL